MLHVYTEADIRRTYPSASLSPQLKTLNQEDRVMILGEIEASIGYEAFDCSIRDKAFAPRRFRGLGLTVWGLGFRV